MAVKRWLQTLFFGSSTEVYGTFRHEVLRRMLLVGLGAVLLSNRDNLFSCYIFQAPLHEWGICLLLAIQIGFMEGMLRRSQRIGLMAFALITIAVGSAILIGNANNGFDVRAVLRVMLISLGGATGFCAGIASKRLFCLILAVLLGQAGGLLGFLGVIGSFAIYHPTGLSKTIIGLTSY